MPAHNFAVMLQIKGGGKTYEHHLECLIMNVPEGTTATAVGEAIKESPFLARFSERGVFLANRRIVDEAKLPEKTNREDYDRIQWTELSKDTVRQFNIRLADSERRQWEQAAIRDGFGSDTRGWIKNLATKAITEGIK